MYLDSYYCNYPVIRILLVYFTNYMTDRNNPEKGREEDRDSLIKMFCLIK